MSGKEECKGSTGIYASALTLLYKAQEVPIGEQVTSTLAIKFPSSLANLVPSRDRSEVSTATSMAQGETDPR